MMLDLPTMAQVHCSDGYAGHLTYLVANPANCQATHLVVRSIRPPFHEVLVPVGRVAETTATRITLKCARGDLDQMSPFEYEGANRPHGDFDRWPDFFILMSPNAPLAPNALPGEFTGRLATYQNVPEDEVAVRRRARVEATDGYAGQVGRLVIDPGTMRVTHLVVEEGRFGRRRAVTIPVSQIDHVDQYTVYLKMDRGSVEALPARPVHRWLP